MMSQTKIQILILCILVAISIALLTDFAYRGKTPDESSNASSVSKDPSHVNPPKLGIEFQDNNNFFPPIPGRLHHQITPAPRLSSLGKKISIYKNHDGSLIQFIVKQNPPTFASLELVGDFNFWLSNDNPSLLKRYQLSYVDNEWRTGHLNYEDLFSNAIDPIKFKFRGSTPSGEYIWLPDYWDKNYQGETGNLMLEQVPKNSSGQAFLFTAPL